MDKVMSINVKKGQRVTCILTWRNFNGAECFTDGKEYAAIDDNFLLDNYLASHRISDTEWFNHVFTLNKSEIKPKVIKYHLSYQFLTDKHEQVFDTWFEFLEACNRIDETDEVGNSTIRFKTEEI